MKKGSRPKSPPHLNSTYKTTQNQGCKNMNLDEYNNGPIAKARVNILSTHIKNMYSEIDSFEHALKKAKIMIGLLTIICAVLSCLVMRTMF